MIEMQDVVKRFEEVEALSGVSFTVPEGSLTVLIGPSGCGKSTTLRLINRLVEPTDGNVLLQGKPVKSFRPEELRRGIGYVIQSIGLLPHLDVRRNIGIVPRLLKWDQPRIDRRADELLELVGLDPEQYRAKYPSQLSGGEAQRIGVARALAADPPVLLMDEPFGAVDPLNRETLQDEFASIQKKLRKTVVFVTHDLDEAVRLADEIVLMRDGRIVQVASPEDILEHPTNNFAQDFVGSDRVLKRLARFSVDEFTQSGSSEEVGDSVARLPYVAAPQEHPARPRWRVNAEGRLVGLSFEASPDVYRPPEPFWVHKSGTLREALSLLLYLHVTHLAVVDAQRRFKGEVSLAAIQSVTRRGSTPAEERQEEADAPSSP
ncbi:MAG: ABC transporter ATP-binding protein, partial [Spirochaetota bacterium]